ncbi:MAG: SpaA isopeptide-forming pilin-related protein, partial [Oscillospiraceae bacterium]|nr:SpaA isopeptide-forming pilin-related protein [Oscillospiraceae bacterium]
MKLHTKAPPTQKWTRTAILAMLIFSLLVPSFMGLTTLAGGYTAPQTTHTSLSLNANAVLSNSFSSQPALDPVPFSDTVSVQFRGRLALTEIPPAWRNQYMATTTKELIVNGTTFEGLCLQPLVVVPSDGVFTGTILPPNHELSHALYWLSGPGRDQFWTAERLARVPATPSGDRRVAATHLMLGYLYGGRVFLNTGWGFVVTPGRAAIRGLIADLDTMPAVPIGNIGFSNTHLIAQMYYPGGVRQGMATPWTAFTAPAGVTITVAPQYGAWIELYRGGAVTYHFGGVAIGNGDQIRFRASTQPPEMEWDSPVFHNPTATMGRAVLINQAAATQTIGGWIGGLGEPQSTQLYVDWDNWIEQLGSLRIQKTVANWHTVQGFQFNVHRNSDNAHIGTFTTGATGWAYVGNLEPNQYYTITEVVPAGFVAPPPVTVRVAAGQVGEASPI